MAVNIDGNGLIALGGTSSTQGRLRLAEDTDNGTNYIELTAPASVGSDRVITFPDVTGTVLTNASAGTVLQVVSATYSTATTVASTSYTDTGLTASITPTSASSKILIITSQPSVAVVGTNASRELYVQLLRSSTSLVQKVGELNSGVASNGFAVTNLDGSFVYLDSPNTTSSTTYKTQGKVDNTANTTELRFQFGSFASTMTLLEIAA